jgi:hypothetical protein
VNPAEHRDLAFDYRHAGLWNEAKGNTQAANEYMVLANLHRALADLYSRPVIDSDPTADIPISVDLG